MSKALFFGVAAIGGMAFFTLVSRYSLCHCATETGTSGGNGETASHGRWIVQRKHVRAPAGRGPQGRKRSHHERRAMAERNSRPSSSTSPAARAPNRPSAARIGIATSTGVYRCVCCGTPLFSSETNSTPAPAGRASGSPSTTRPWAKWPTAATACGGSRSSAASARPIWAMSSTTDPIRPACGTASIRPR